MEQLQREDAEARRRAAAEPPARAAAATRRRKSADGLVQTTISLQPRSVIDVDDPGDETQLSGDRRRPSMRRSRERCGRRPRRPRRPRAPARPPAPAMDLTQDSSGRRRRRPDRWVTCRPRGRRDRAPTTTSWPTSGARARATRRSTSRRAATTTTPAAAVAVPGAPGAAAERGHCYRRITHVLVTARPAPRGRRRRRGRRASPGPRRCRWPPAPERPPRRRPGVLRVEHLTKS